MKKFYYLSLLFSILATVTSYANIGDIWTVSDGPSVMTLNIDAGKPPEEHFSLYFKEAQYVGDGTLYTTSKNDTIIKFEYTGTVNKLTSIGVMFGKRDRNHANGDGFALTISDKPEVGDQFDWDATISVAEEELV